jgi:hypothetical protein
MALNLARVADVSFAALVGAESMKLHAYSGFTLLVLMSPATDHKVLRRHLAVRAAETGVIAKNTWESYAKGIDTAAAKFVTHAAGEVAAILDMKDEADAVDAVRCLYEGLNILSGSDIRDWSKAEGFEPLDKAAAKAAKAAKAKEDKLAKDAGAAALFFAGNAADSSAISDMATAPVSAIDAILAAIAALGSEADALAALEAVNTRLATMQAAKDAAPEAEAVAPVLADDKAPSAASTLAAHFNRKAA